jgi:hypothetical protein
MWKTVIALSAAILAGWLCWLLMPNPDSRMERVASTGETDLKRAQVSDAESGMLSGAKNEKVSIELRMRQSLIRLKDAEGEIEGQRILKELVDWLKMQSSGAVGSAIEQVLAEGQDGFAFGRFAPGPDGFLISYPTFRTGLLDVLEHIDPEKAVAVGKSILSDSDNSDEWALSLRTLSKYAVSLEDRAFLSGKIEELLLKDEWLKDPVFSYLHAFDTAVANGEAVTIARLGELVENGPNKAVTHAATLSVDRFFQMHPVVAGQFMVSNFLASEPGFRASLMARSDPGVDQGRDAVEAYLAGDIFAESEKRIFINSYPNFNTTYSYNLVTGSLLLPRTEMKRRSLEALGLLQEWLADGKYPQFKDEMNSAIQRLAKTWKVN